MGHGIVQAFAVAGHHVRCYDPLEAARESTVTRIESNLQREVEASLFSADRIAGVLAGIEVCDSEAEAVTGATFVTEAAAEDLELKCRLFARLETLVPSSTILASNTSTWPMTKISAQMKSPQRAINTHWFNPPHIVPLVEVIPGQQTSEDTTRASLELLLSLGKTAVRLNKELPGFLINRVQIAMYREILDLLEQGVASAEDIDRAFRASVGFRSAAVGPLQVYDFAGIDVSGRCYSELVQDIRSDRQLPDLVQQLIANGDYGVKTGRGVFEYTSESTVEKIAERDRGYLALKKLFYAETGRTSS